MLLEKIVSLLDEKEPLRPADVPQPSAGPGEVLIRITACGVCHTELDEIEGRTPPPALPVIPGHQAVGVVEKTGEGVTHHKVGDRVGVAWIFSSCGKCKYCLEGDDNLCPEFRATGRDADGGYAEYMKVGEDCAFKIPDTLSDAEAAPMLCAGAIGYRSLRLTGIGDGQPLGLTGFGASGHLVLKMARHLYPNTGIYVFARSEAEREFAKELGAAWAGDTVDAPPRKLDAIIDTTPVWKPVVEALRNLNPGGRLVINAIRKEDADKDYLLKLDYPSHIWMEKEIKSVANVSRKDVRGMLELAANVPIIPEVEEYALEDANRALVQLKRGRIKGAKVLRMV
jgi:propanol-preferring alcohol dehydrogenase